MDWPAASTYYARTTPLPDGQVPDRRGVSTSTARGPPRTTRSWTPEETSAFLQDYELAGGAPFVGAEQRAAAAEAAWIVAFNARWENR